MHRLHTTARSVVCLTVLTLAAQLGVACGDDDDPQTAPPKTDAGNDSSAGRGGTGGSGGTGSGGASGTTTGGSAGSAGTSGSTGDAGPDADAAADAQADSDAATDGQADADDGAAAGVVLATTTNFVSTEMVSVDSRTGQVLSRSTFADGDAVVLARGSKGFVLERTRDVLSTLQSNGAIAASIPLQSPDAGGDAGGSGLNPRDVVVVDNQAYVPLFNQSAIVVVDLQSNTVTSTIDLSSLVDTKDNDGSIDLSSGFLDNGKLYFVAGRIDITTIKPSNNYRLSCPSEPGLLIVIDPATNSVVVPPGRDAGSGLDLTLVNPSDAVLDATGHKILISNGGCFRGSNRVLHGVEAVDLTTGVTTIAYAPPNQNFVNRMLLSSPNGVLLQTNDANFTEFWNLLSVTTGALGANLANVPAAAVLDGNTLVGVKFESQGEAGTRGNIVRVRLDGAASVIATNPWTANYTNASSVAVVR